jgi:uncharacterized membrane protein
MNSWMLFALVAIALYGVVGLFQKMATTRVSATIGRELRRWLLAAISLPVDCE